MLNKSYTIRFSGDDLKRLRSVISYYDRFYDLGLYVSDSQIIRKITNERYEELLKQKKIVDIKNM